MSLKLYMDENVHGAITTGLRLRDVDVLTVQEDGYSGSPDPVILDRSTAPGRIVFTQDRDFLVEGSHRQTVFPIRLSQRRDSTLHPWAGGKSFPPFY